MLTDLNFLAPGRMWPPPAERERLKGYAENCAMFENDHGKAFREAFTRIERTGTELGVNGALSVRHELVVSYPKRISVATASLLFGEPVGVVAGDESDTAAMDEVSAISERSAISEKLLASAIDVSRYGDGVFLVHQDEDTGEALIDITRPDVWFPVVDARNLRRTLYHVLATPWRRAVATDTDAKPDTLRVEIHERGKITVRDYALTTGSALGRPLGADVITRTGMSGFAVVPVHNLRTSDRVHGIDDYDDIQSLVCELDIRLSQIARVLDRHSDPTMQGPEEALTEDKDGNRVFVPGTYFVNKASGVDGTTSGKIEYLTWDAQLAANFTMCTQLIEQIRAMSELGVLLSDMSDKMGSIPSGSALRRLLTSAMNKINRLRQSYDPVIKQVFRLCSELGGGTLKDKAISLRWSDGLPGDAMEDAQIAQIRTASKATMSRKRALMTLDQLSEKDAEAELESIIEDDSSDFPLTGSGLGGSVDLAGSSPQETPPKVLDKVQTPPKA